MKKYTWYIVLFFVFLVFFYVKDYLYSFLLSRDDFLETTVVLESDYQNLKNDYDALVQTNELWDTTSDEFITTKVVLRDSYVFMDKITILKGSEQGITIGDVVINQDGYVGKIVSTWKNSSQVELLTNQNTELSVRIGNSYGILKRENEELFVSDIISKETIEEGMTVYTSNYTDIPGDIVVGVVSEVKSNALEQVLKVTPSVDFQNLNYVFVRKKVVYD